MVCIVVARPAGVFLSRRSYFGTLSATTEIESVNSAPFIETGKEVLPPDEYMRKYSPNGNTATLNLHLKSYKNKIIFNLEHNIKMLMLLKSTRNLTKHNYFSHT